MSTLALVSHSECVFRSQESALRKMLVEVGASDSASKFEDCSGLRCTTRCVTIRLLPLLPPPVLLPAILSGSFAAYLSSY